MVNLLMKLFFGVNKLDKKHTVLHRNCYKLAKQYLPISFVFNRVKINTL